MRPYAPRWSLALCLTAACGSTETKPAPVAEVQKELLNLPTGLVASYPLDGTTVETLSGQSGTAVSVTTTVDRFGRANKAYSFTANNGPTRSGTIDVGNTSFSVTQTGQNTCAYSLFPPSNFLGFAAQGREHLLLRPADRADPILRQSGKRRGGRDAGFRDTLRWLINIAADRANIASHTLASFEVLYQAMCRRVMQYER